MLKNYIVTKEEKYFIIITFNFKLETGSHVDKHTQKIFYSQNMQVFALKLMKSSVVQVRR